MSNHDSETIEAVETTIAIIEALDERDEAGISELAEALDVAKSTIHRHVKTLERQEMVYSQEGKVLLSTEFLRLGNGVRFRSEVSPIAEEVVETLAEETDERANFFIEEFGYIVCLHRKIGERGVVAGTEIGTRFLMHCTAAGKAILSLKSERAVRDVIDRHGLPQRTSNTITSFDALTEEIEAVRKEGIAFNNEESIKNLRSIGVPVELDDSLPVGAFTISGPANRLSDERIDEELSEALLSAANELELRAKY